MCIIFYPPEYKKLVQMCEPFVTYERDPNNKRYFIPVFADDMPELLKKFFLKHREVNSKFHEDRFSFTIDYDVAWYPELYFIVDEEFKVLLEDYDIYDELYGVSKIQVTA